MPPMRLNGALRCPQPKVLPTVDTHPSVPAVTGWVTNSLSHDGLPYQPYDLALELFMMKVGNNLSSR